jgi:hypothetical protein
VKQAVACYTGGMGRGFGWLLVLTIAACGTPGVVQTAMNGDLSTLKRKIAESRRAGDLDRATVEELAAAVAGREVRSAKGTEAVRRIRAVRSCATPLLPVLEDRAARTDDAAAEATLVLLELGRLSRGPLFARYAEASSGAWRAVGARSAVGKKAGPARRRLIRDPDERARRAALQAAIESADAADLEELLETARLDPDPLSRGLATRAAGAIGGERAVIALDDHWVRADETTRITIVEAWTMPAALRSGGERKLLWAAESTRGLPALAAAGALVRIGGPNAAVGTALLARGIREGTAAERRLAMATAPLSDTDVRKSLVQATKSDDREVRVLALARMLDDPPSRDHALGPLRELAKGRDPAAIQARTALATAGDSSVSRQLVEQLAAASAEHRTLAAVGLLDLGDYAGAAAGLADDDPEVRTRVACTALAH